VLLCSGKPIGAMHTRQRFTNFEMVVEWRHLRPAGNSGVFAWVPDEALAQLKPDALPEHGHRSADARPRWLAQPRTGYLCLESEGSPFEFKNIRVRELP